jgi:hypothetical protein
MLLFISNLHSCQGRVLEPATATITLTALASKIAWLFSHGRLTTTMNAKPAIMTDRPDSLRITIGGMLLALE